MKRIIFIFSLVILLTIGCRAEASEVGDVLDFNVDPNYDMSARAEIETTLIKTSSKLYFFIDKNWWSQQNNYQQSGIVNNLEVLAQEFERKIYPTLTTVFGSERKPGIDGDERITILFHPMREGAGGYFRVVDEYLRLQSPESNEREMVYLSTAQIENPQLKSFLAHEFVHLVTFNQKDKTLGVSEEIWLNEARAEYAPTLLGYDDVYEGSNLQHRVKNFLDEPSDSLTEWQNKKSDYGVLNIFTQYLVDYYSLNILADSLKSQKTGILSINEALSKNGFMTDFSKIFTDWNIAVLLNDCSVGPKYCYLNKNLKNLRVSPVINFLPLVGKSTLSVTNITKNWSGNWQKVIGGNGVLTLEFVGLAGLNFKVPYVIQNASENYSINFLTLDKNQGGEVSVSDFGTTYRTLIILPSLQTKTSGFDGIESTYPFTITVSVAENTPNQEELIKKLLAQISFLQQEIVKTQAQLDIALGKTTFSCRIIQNNLYLGMRNNPEVRCLQEFLKSQGQEIYPEGIISGNFLSLTRAAAIRFQEKYASEILLPFGLTNGTGFVGQKTLAVINRLLGL